MFGALFSALSDFFFVSSMPMKFRYRKGLTLVEIVVVVMIVSILVVYVSTALMNFIRPSVADTVEKFRGVLLYSYRMAMLHNQAVIIKIDLDEKRYTAFRIVRTDEGIEEKKFLDSGFPSNSKIRSIVDIRGVKYETGIVNVPFTYTGVGEDFSFHFGDDTTTVKTVLLYRYNGKVVVKPGEVIRRAKEDTNTGGSINFDDTYEP